MSSVLREAPAFVEAKAHFSKIGKVRHAVVSWQSGEKVSALALAGQAFEYLEWFLGPADAVNARFPDTAGKHSLVMTRLRFAPGFYANLSVASDVARGGGHRIEIYGEAGSLILELADHETPEKFRLHCNGERVEVPARMPMVHERPYAERVQKIVDAAVSSDAQAGKAVFF
jgi:predicted dehydrogenase